MSNVDLKVNRRIVQDKLIISIYLFFVFVLRYFLVPEYSSIYNAMYMLWGLLIFLFMLIKILFKNSNGSIPDNINMNQYYRSLLWLILLMLSVLLLVTFNFIIKGLSMNGWNNIRKILDVFLPVTFFIHISSDYSLSELYKIIRYVARIMNIYFFLNIPIILMEYFTGSFMVSRFLGVNSYLSDQVTGFIGLNGTAIMSLYWASLLFINYAIYIATRNKSRISLMVFEFVVMFFVSQYLSEIKNFVPTLMVLLLTLILIQINKRISLRFIRNIFFIIVLAIITFFVLYNVSNSFKEIINNFLQVYFELISGANQGSDIRIHTLWVSFNELRDIGFSNIDFSTQNYVAQLDVTSLNTLIIFGGIKLTMVIFFITSQLLSIITNRRIDGNYLWSNVGYVIFILYISIVTVPYQEPRLFLFIYILAMEFHFIMYLKQEYSSKFKL